MRVGVILPSFEADAAEAGSCAAVAEEAGIHGVFAYDHLWPPGEPGRPALAPFPLLGMLAAVTSRLMLGTLVARIGLVPENVLCREFRTLDTLSGHRLIAGDRDGRPSQCRREPRLRDPPGNRRGTTACRPLRRRRISSEPVSPCGSGPARRPTNAIAREVGATVNLFGAGADRVAKLGRSGAVSWGGVLRRGAEEAADQFRSLNEAGATWAVVGWPGSVSADRPRRTCRRHRARFVRPPGRSSRRVSSGRRCRERGASKLASEWSAAGDRGGLERVGSPPDPNGFLSHDRPGRIDH